MSDEKDELEDFISGKMPEFRGRIEAAALEVAGRLYMGSLDEKETPEISDIVLVGRQIAKMWFAEELRERKEARARQRAKQSTGP